MVMGWWQDGIVTKRWIVVGGGVAGSVVAARLAAAGASVAVLERGVDGATPDDLHEAASLPGRTIGDLRVRRVSGGPLVSYTCGSGLGGGSSINPGWAAGTGPFHHSHALPIEGIGVDRRVLEGGSRASVSDVYLNQAGIKDRVEIRTEVTVERVVIDHGRVAGVELFGGEVVAGDVVVLCAGALMSPALLLRSGVSGGGVGLRIQDHPSVALRYRNVGEGSHGSIRLRRSGFIQVIETVIADELWVVPALMRPLSSGVTSLDEDGSLAVQFDLCQYESERSAIAEAIEEAISTHDDLEPVNTPHLGQVTEWLMNQLATTTPVYSHASGGCAMGAVTDRSGRVNGVDNLFVVDASVFPSIPSVNPMVPTVQLAEIITQRWMAEGIVAN